MNFIYQIFTEATVFIKANSCNIFPAWYQIQKAQDTITPPVHTLPQPFTGVYCLLKDAVQMTMDRISAVDTIDLPASNSNLHLKIKFGFDGSGGHSMYKILNETGIKWDFPNSTGQRGSTTTGNVAHCLLHSETNRELIVSSISSVSDKLIAAEYGELLSTIVQVVSSE